MQYLAYNAVRSIIIINGNDITTLQIGGQPQNLLHKIFLQPVFYSTWQSFKDLSLFSRQNNWEILTRSTSVFRRHFSHLKSTWTRLWSTFMFKTPWRTSLKSSSSRKTYCKRRLAEHQVMFRALSLFSRFLVSLKFLDPSKCMQEYVILYESFWLSSWSMKTDSFFP